MLPLMLEHTPALPERVDAVRRFCSAKLLRQSQGDGECDA